MPTSRPCCTLVSPRKLFRPDGRLLRVGAALQGARNGVRRGRRGREDGLVWVGRVAGSHQDWAVCMMAGSVLWLQVGGHGWGGKVTGSGWQGVATHVVTQVDGRCSHLFPRVQSPPVPCDRGLWVGLQPPRDN